MEASLKMLRTVRMAMLGALVLYVFVGERTPHSAKSTNVVFYYLIAFTAAAIIVATVVIRRTAVLRAEQALSQNVQDFAALRRWRAGCIVIYALCEAVALYGFVLRFMGFSLSQVAPFYVAGFVLLFFFSPRLPSNTIG